MKWSEKHNKEISFFYQLEQSVIVYRRLLRVFFPSTKVTKHEMVMDPTISSFSRIRVISEFQISHFQNKAKCKTFLVKMSFILMRAKKFFQINGFTLSFALKQSLGATQKWLIPILPFYPCWCIITLSLPSP